MCSCLKVLNLILPSVSGLFLSQPASQRLIGPAYHGCSQLKRVNAVHRRCGRSLAALSGEKGFPARDATRRKWQCGVLCYRVVRFHNQSAQSVSHSVSQQPFCAPNWVAVIWLLLP